MSKAFNKYNNHLPHSTAISTWWCSSRSPEFVRSGCWPSQKFQTPQTLPRQLFFHGAGLWALFFSCIISFPCFFSFSLLMKIGNACLKPGPIFPFVFTGNMIWRGRSMKCASFLNWVHLQYTLLSSKFYSYSVFFCRVFFPHLLLLLGKFYLKNFGIGF